jgi:hypothetical protein
MSFKQPGELEMSTSKSTRLYGEVMAFLAGVREHFDQEADCDLDDRGYHRPNEAMRMCCAADEAMANLTAMANVMGEEELARIDRIMARMVLA